MAIHSPLLRLPRELRDKVYCYAFEDPVDELGQEKRTQHVVDIAIQKASFYEDSIVRDAVLAPICRTCTQLYWETAPLSLSSITLQITSEATADLILRWLSSTPGGDNFMASIHHLTFPSLPSKRNRARLELLYRCTNLRTLSLSLSYKDSDLIPRSILREYSKPHREAGRQISRWDQEGTPEVWKYIRAQYLVRMVEVYQLHRVSDFPNLEKIYVCIESEASNWTERNYVCMQLVDRMKKEFQKRGRDDVAVVM